MKMLGLGAAAVSALIGLAAAGGTHSLRTAESIRFPAECIVTVAVAPGYLPRAGLIVENRRPEPVQLWLEGRPGSGLTRADLGVVGGRDRRDYAYALPAGRNLLTARDASGRPYRQLFYVTNHGAGTCGRRYVWQIV